MIIFIRRIPSNTTQNDLYHFVNPALKGGLFRKSGHIIHCDILIIRDHHTADIEYHGLVKIDLDDAAIRAIKKLKGKKLNNHPVIVREYVVRSAHNDRRQDFNTMKAHLNNQRAADRRRHNQASIISSDTPVFTSDPRLSRKHQVGMI